MASWHRGTVLPTLDTGATNWWVVRATLRPLYPYERDLVPIAHEAGKKYKSSVKILRTRRVTLSSIIRPSPQVLDATEVSRRDLSTPEI